MPGEDKTIGANLDFHTIDLPNHLDTALKFRADSYRTSFGNIDLFDSEFYAGWLKQRIKQFPEGHVHIWVDGEIVGQIEARPHHSGQENLSSAKSSADLRLPKQDREGYINLYYLAPQWRGKGIAGRLDAYAKTYLLSHGCISARLSVSKTNIRALAFYAKYGWRAAGDRPDQPDMQWMTKDFSPAQMK